MAPSQVATGESPLSTGINPTFTAMNSVKDLTKVASYLIVYESRSYPTQCLKFLEDVPKSENGDIPNGHVKDELCLNIIVVGAGLGGLATAVSLARRGHKVTVFEQAPELGEVGAGIQIPSNSSRLLLQWGLGPLLDGRVVEPESISFRRWQSGETIGFTKLVPEFRANFGGPYYVVHRAHFHDALHQRALQLGVQVKLNCLVKDYDMDTPSITLADGHQFIADLIIAADGVKSIARKYVLGVDSPPLETGFAAYRATVDVERMKEDPDVSWLLEKPGLNVWIGDMRHVMTYTISAGKSFNMVLSHPHTAYPSNASEEDVVKEMKSHFKGWDPRLTKLINLIEKTLKWPLLSGTRLDRWIAESGKLLILGDAAHAMVPYMSQGAAMAVEDAAALGEAISKVSTLRDLPAALHLFEKVRIERTSQMQEASLTNGKLWHFADGPEQQARDEGMRPEVEARHYIKSPNQWSDPVTQWWCYGYDAESEITHAWRHKMGS